MAGPTLTTDALVLLKRPPTDSFQTFTVFSAEHGLLLVLQRLSKKSSSTAVALDLFDEATLILESANQGQTWFVKEARLLTRHSGLGRSYETLQASSTLAQLIARNTVHEESRPKVYALLREALTALAASDRPDIVYLKSLYRFARDEGYPVKEHWFPTLPAADRDKVAVLLNHPIAAQNAELPIVARLQRRLEGYLRGHTEILLD
jgi:recombinational DNA repair protein (RecF pathway)